MKAPAEVSAPYSPGQLAALRAWAEQLTGQARADALALMGLACGCGLAPDEVTAARGSHLRRLPSGAVVVSVPGTDRLVVVRSAWEQHLAEAAQAAGEDFLFRPRRTTPAAKNLLNAWTAGTGSPLACPRCRPAGCAPARSSNC